MKKASLGRFTIQKSYEVELPTVLQDCPPKSRKRSLKKKKKGKKKTFKLVTAGLEFGHELKLKQKGWKDTS